MACEVGLRELVQMMANVKRSSVFGPKRQGLELRAEGLDLRVRGKDYESGSFKSIFHET